MATGDISEMAQLQARVAQLEESVATLTDALLQTQEAFKKRGCQLDGLTAVLIGVAATLASSPELNKIGKTVVKAAIDGHLASSLNTTVTDAHILGTSEWTYRLLPETWKTMYKPA